MLQVYAEVGRFITRTERRDDALYLFSDAYKYRIEPKTDHILRITMTGKDSFIDTDKPGVVYTSVYKDWSFREEEHLICMELGQIHLLINKETGAFTYCDKDDNVLLQEREYRSKCLEEYSSYRLADNGGVEKEIVKTADGDKEIVRSADRVEDERIYHSRMHFLLDDEECLYGMGQQEEGILNLRGNTVFVHQANRKIAIPFLVSSKNYGILIDTYGPMVFNDNSYGTYLYTQADRELDYYFIAAGSMEDVVKGYRLLTGKATLLPKWAYGYLQSQERYETQEEILAVAEEYKKRGLGLDGIVLDWCSWRDGLWGQKEFDPSRFPDAKAMTEELHKKDVHFMISIWPNMSENCSDYQEFQQAGLLLPASNVYNAFSKEGRKLYWKQVEKALYCMGVDAFWCDSSEPYTPEWNHLMQQEPFAMYTEFCSETENHIPAWMTNAFALYHARSIYEGQRGVKTLYGKEKRVFNLTRSAYTGQQRYGTVMWSGDTAASWETFRRQIANGLAFSASGLPYWTADIGAFFVKTGEPWYWTGDYPDTVDNLGYRELFVRWYQWGCFLPIFRGHGTDCRRELWSFGEKGSVFYEALEKMNHLRYRLLPYIYSLAGNVWREDRSFISPLIFHYGEDETARALKDEFMFGDDLLICPVTEPMYYDRYSRELKEHKKTKRVYLPKGNGWYDFWTKQYHDGGQWLEVDAPLDIIPVFVREGAILALSEYTGNVQGTREIYLEIYEGRNGSLMLYEDEGDGYAFEEGDYVLREIQWDDTKKACSVKAVHGDSRAAYVKKIAEYKRINKEEK